MGMQFQSSKMKKFWRRMVVMYWMPPNCTLKKWLRWLILHYVYFVTVKKKTRKHDRLFKIQEIIEKQLVFSLDIFRNEIEMRELFFQVRENTALWPFSPKSFFQELIGFTLSIITCCLGTWRLNESKTLFLFSSKWDKRHIYVLIL